MNRRLSFAFLALALCVALVSDVVAGPISIGNLVVTRVGTGAAALSSSATNVFVEEFETDGTPVQTIAMPTVVSGSNRILTMNGSATSEGFLKLSTNHGYVTLAGYDKAPGGSAPATDAASTTNRVVGRIEVSTGNIDTTTALNNAHSTSNIRGAITTNGTDIWTSGSGSSGTGLAPGVTYTTLGATTATRVNTSGNNGTNRRVVDIFDGQLYVSGSTTGGPNFSVNTVGTGLPTAPSAEANIPGLPTTATHSIYDFWFRDDSTLYLADDGTAANGGGIQKWTFDGSTWSLAYIMLNNGTTATAVRGLTGVKGLAGSSVLYATTGATLITVTDLGVDVDVSTTLATAATNTAFRGVDIIVPEPASIALIGLAGLALAGLARRHR